MPPLHDNLEDLNELSKPLWEENQRLKNENAERRRRLGRNSTNSDKPPRSEGYRQKTKQPGLPRKPGSGKGGQKGHEGRTLKRVEEPNHVPVHLPEQGESCGRTFGTADEYEIIQSRQVFDLPEPKLEVTEPRLGQITGGGKEQRGEYPLEVKTPVPYGAGVRALIVELSVEYQMPLESIGQLFADRYGYNLNSPTILEAFKRSYELAAPLEEPIQTERLESPVVHCDETGIRVEGQRHGLHTASNEENTHLYLHKKRGTEAMNSEGSIRPDFKGIAGHDCGSSYFTFNPARHALCGAHL